MSIRTHEHIWIPLSDGTRLGARIWLPEADGRYPAVLEYIPYRKRDGTRGRDEPMHGYFAQNGYAGIRVDMRGSGESEGHLADEYLVQEQDDALEVIAWIAAQDWCDGNVGMMGKSWGGFNGLQVAARRPPALKAIITAYSTDNRYTDDIHYMGGLLLNDNLWWGTIMLAYQARPLDPAIVGDSWRKSWLERIEKLPFFPGLWMEHQRYDDYWKHGSVCEDFSNIEVPVLAIGGWSDSYTNAVPRLLEGLKTPRKAIIGPWGHVYPQDGIPGPAIGFLQEAVRWWDHWLKGEDTGIMAEPDLRAYVNDSVVPTGTRTDAPGRWVGEPSWPSPSIVPHAFTLGADHQLHVGTAPAGKLNICSPLSHGKASGEWMATGCPGEHPVDQRLDDGGALVFDTPILADEIEILGAPILKFRLASDKPVAQIVARLSDVRPDGAVSRVSFQVLNLTHRDSHEHPEPLTPGQFYDVTIKLNDCGYRFAKGHSIRLAIGTAYWPMVWPSPELATLTIDTAGSTLELPVRREDGPAIVFANPAHGPMAPISQVDPGTVRRWTLQDHVAGTTTYVTEGIGGLFGEGILRFDEIDTTLSHTLKRELTISDTDPSSAHYLLTQSYEMGRDGWRIHIESITELRSDEERFYLSGELKVSENGQNVAKRQWSENFLRDLI